MLNGLAQWHEGQSEDVQLAFKLQDWRSAGSHVPWTRDRANDGVPAALGSFWEQVEVAERLAEAKEEVAEQVWRSAVVFTALVERQVDEELSGATAAIRRIRDALVPQALGAWEILEKYGMLDDAAVVAHDVGSSGDWSARCVVSM
eukprot:COSAG04_NODE_2167_length_4641_cov_5.518274_3_plen_146_part_00